MSVIPTVSVVFIILVCGAVGVFITSVCEEPECSTNEDCSNSTVCWEQQKCIDPCQLTTCGRDAICRATNHVAVCACQTGYTGDPLTSCQPPVPECNTNEDCPSDRTCVGERCIDPCHMIVCGQNTLCHAANHTASCICPLGQTWEPLNGCQQLPPGKQVCTSSEQCDSDRVCIKGSCINPCQPTPCGQDTFCHVSNHLVMCSCQNGFIWNPYTGCLRVGQLKEKKKYVVYNDTWVNWHQALVHCSSRNMRLATIKNQEEQDTLHSMVKAISPSYEYWWWIGGSDLGETGNFLWMSSGEVFTYSNWMEGKPNNYKHTDGEVHHCMNMHGPSGTWTDSRCSNKYSPVCEGYV